MDGQLVVVLAVAICAAVASPLGGLIAILLNPTTLLLSIFVGYAGGVLMGTFAFEMMPKALEQSSLLIASGGFALGFGLVYGLDFYINRGALAGPKSSQRRWVEGYHKRRAPRGSQVTVLAGATSVEELIEGLTIGVGSAIDPTVAVIAGLAVGIDNIAEALSIGALQREENQERYAWPIFKWTGLIGISLFGSAMLGWFLFRNLSEVILGFLLATGGGGMFYLAVTDLIPEAEEHQYQESAAISIAAGFLTVFVLSEVL
ncbi:ZIP family zinc transporter [Sinorhizobium fredii]|jgi:zinc transporter, ZIP family|uniref:Zinc/iron permease n=1 Tax=Sinorhizobium fredii (strain USDA 257) TaxID=1185652 RepID=I3XCS0_SINF2|nr:ZIP family metal transporter [Sinorhizobium fredii]AFL53676.1 zinc/iron permease [Sinorhizobium fredii USDA 257]